MRPVTDNALEWGFCQPHNRINHRQLQKPELFVQRNGTATGGCVSSTQTVRGPGGTATTGLKHEEAQGLFTTISGHGNGFGFTTCQNDILI